MTNLYMTEYEYISRINRSLPTRSIRTACLCRMVDPIWRLFHRGGTTLRSACTTAQLRFLARGANGGKRGGIGKITKGADRGPAVAAATNYGGAGKPSGVVKPFSRGGAGFSKSDMLAARQARKASLAEAGTTMAKKVKPPVAPVGKGTTATTAVAGGRRSRWGLGTTVLALTSTGLAVLAIAWQLKPDEVRELLDDSPIDHVAIWFMKKFNEVSIPCRLKS